MPALTQIISVSASLAIATFLLVGFASYIRASGDFDAFIKETTNPDFEELKQISYRYDRAAGCAIAAMLLWLVLK